ncbi:MAG: RecX family transcriptional regulator [Desulfosporosinus sp.]|nr:RecX family transcriptional regulator [Desulfosporosinus sp.]
MMMVHLTNSKPLKSAQEVAVDCLSRRPLTHYELETRLKEKGYQSLEVKEVLEKMAKLGYLNDQDLALTVSQSRLKRYSQRRVRQDLQNRGLEPHVIEQALELTYSSDDEFQQCLTLAERWWLQESKRWEQRVQDQNKDTRTALPRQLLLQQKVARKLVQRGYPSDMVRNVLYQIQTNSNDNTQ